MFDCFEPLTGMCIAKFVISIGVIVTPARCGLSVGGKQPLPSSRAVALDAAIQVPLWVTGWS